LRKNDQNTILKIEKGIYAINHLSFLAKFFLVFEETGIYSDYSSMEESLLGLLFLIFFFFLLSA